MEQQDLIDSIKKKADKLCADFDTVAAEQKKWVDRNDGGVVHESTGKYVTESTAGFFPDRTVPAYKLCSLFKDMLELYDTRKLGEVKNVAKKFEEALWEGFLDPTNKKSRKKKTNFRVLRMDVKPQEYNDLLADVYEEAAQLLQGAQKSKDKVGEQIFGTVMYIAAIASDAKTDPFNFENEYQLQGLDFIEKAINLKFYLK